jgi:branched-chain amino acid transport system substrate-binding protein
VCVLALAGCLGGDPGATPRVPGGTLTIYASVPERGVSAGAAAAVAAGERRALADAHGRAGHRRVRLVQLDSTRAGGRIWDPAQVSANAKRAADDPSTIAYVGELDYGASAVSVPITNDKGILQVSPEDGLTSLTRTPPGRPRAGPDRYYPSGRRTFVRLVPSDLLEAEALLGRVRAAGPRRLAIVSGTGIYDTELAAELAERTDRERLRGVGSELYDGDPDDVPGIVRKLGQSRPDAVIYVGVAGPAVAPLLAEVRRRIPQASLFAAGGLLAGAPEQPTRAAPDGVEALTSVLPASAMPAHGRRLLRAIAGDGRAARPDALYGYESVRLVLDAVEAAGPSRTGVVRAALRSGRRHGMIGIYRVRATGDVAGGRFAEYRLEDGRFAFQRVLP